jgi:hypothetical protein
MHNSARTDVWGGEVWRMEEYWAMEIRKSKTSRKKGKMVPNTGWSGCPDVTDRLQRTSWQPLDAVPRRVVWRIAFRKQVDEFWAFRRGAVQMSLVIRQVPSSSAKQYKEIIHVVLDCAKGWHKVTVTWLKGTTLFCGWSRDITYVLLAGLFKQQNNSMEWLHTNLEESLTITVNT